MKILIIDNYDSFTYNLAQLFGELKTEPIVIRNNMITLEEVERMSLDAIVISPGPGHPANKRDFGICSDVITHLGPKIPILGVCLGHQGIVHVYGGKVVHAKKLRHGKTSDIEHNNNGIFDGVSNPFRATRYHSLVAQPETIPKCLEVTARSKDDGEVMGIKHRDYLTIGVQFHPESVLTDDGKKILLNFLKLVKR
ncbi:MAG: aminodeoxychorismate/anthranilate synthase component II [Nitrososphaerales archaeon]